MNNHVVDLASLDGSMTALAGGKAANLGQLMRIDGLDVPAGFCVTTAAWHGIVAPVLDPLLDRLSGLDATDHDAVTRTAAEIRAVVAGVPLPSDLQAAITDALAALGHGIPTAVRSSATAEDSPTASFAGQLDSFLGIVGPDAVLRHLRLCWASLFTQRAVRYRLQHGLDHRDVQVAVIVQRLLDPTAAGVLFTADPVTGNRRLTCIEAVNGLGDALVSGRDNADAFQVRDDRIVHRRQREQATLTDPQVLHLARLGRHIEAHLGQPQDIEWCLVDDTVHVVQARPITTLFPIPQGAPPGNRVFMSVGHNQVMTDAMKPLGRSLWQHTTPRPMLEAGGRLFVDVTVELRSPTIRAGFLAMMQRSDPLTGGALQAIVDRDGFLPPPDPPPEAPGPAGPVNTPDPIPANPAIVTALMADTRASIATLEREIRSHSGVALVDFILADLAELQRLLRVSHQAAMAGMEATWWLNEHIETWLGDKNAADALSLAAPHNITSEMGLALLRLADVVRPHADVVALLEDAPDGSFLEALPQLDGGERARAAFVAFLAEYGARGVGEIDITRPRWSEQPAALLPLVLNHVRNARPGAADRLVEEGRRQAALAQADVLDRLRALPDGQAKAEQARQMIERLRTFIGFREFPKYGLVRRYAIYKQALMEQAARLVHAGLLADPRDIFHLSLPELREVAAGVAVDPQLIHRRKQAHAANQRLSPPRVITSDGEIVSGTYRRDRIPDGALVGLAVSAGVVEGRARVVLALGDATLEPGDILVTRFTDPSWTPVFLGIAGLVTEVGGQMTHGSVIARELGLPAVVAVEGATGRIRDGQHIRVDGAAGYVQILPDSEGRAR